MHTPCDYFILCDNLEESLVSLNHGHFVFISECKVENHAFIKNWFIINCHLKYLHIIKYRKSALFKCR